MNATSLSPPEDERFGCMENVENPAGETVLVLILVLGPMVNLYGTTSTSNVFLDGAHMKVKYPQCGQRSSFSP